MKDNNSEEKKENVITEVKRTSDPKYIVQKRKPSVFLSVLLVLIGAVATAVIMLIFFGDKIISADENNIQVEENVPENKNEENKEEEKVEIKAPDLSLDGEFIKGLYKKIPMQYFSQAVYNYNRTTEAAFTGNQKMLFILNDMRLNKQYEIRSVEGIFDRLQKTMDVDGYIQEVQVYDINEVEDYFKSVFGINQNIVKEDIETNMGYVYEYDEQDDCFYGHYYAGGGGFGFYQKNMIDSVEKSDDNKEIYVYDYYIKVTTDYTSGTRKNNVYTYSGTSNSIDEIEDTADTFLLDEAKGVELLEKYKKDNLLVKFKHTFKLDDNGNYYWYCCEALNQD